MVYLKGEAEKTRLVETLSYSKSKTCKAKKLKLYKPVYLRSFLALHVLDLEQFKVSGGLVFAGTPFNEI